VLDGETGVLTSTAGDAILAGVERLLDDDPLRRKMGDAAADHAARRFGVRRLIADTEQLYASLLEPAAMADRAAS
jgi:glycosyltransferase involved in cell wall biosynthesis